MFFNFCLLYFVMQLFRKLTRDVRGYVQKVCSNSFNVFLLPYYYYPKVYSLICECCSVLIMGKMLICNLLSKQKPSLVVLNTHLPLVIGAKQMLRVQELEFHRSNYLLFTSFIIQEPLSFKEGIVLIFLSSTPGVESLNLCIYFVSLAKT